VRDVAAYLIASAVTLALLWDGAFARYEAIVQILLYMLYLSICVYTSRCAMDHPMGQRRPVVVCQSAGITIQTSLEGQT
jgi:Ca2+/Na+ antiporter